MTVDLRAPAIDPNGHEHRGVAPDAPIHPALLYPPGMAPEPTESDEPRYTIDELAAAAHVPTRTIRFYQARGALMRPEIRGRVAYYGAVHLERLRFIAQLQDRGLRIDAIRDLVGSIDKGELDLAQWLGVEQQVDKPWSDDQARVVGEDELYTLAASRRPGLLADLVRTRLVARHGDVYLVRSPSLLQIATRLEGAGIDLETAVAASKILDKHLRRAVKELVGLFVKRIKDGSIAISEPDNLFSTLRPLATEAVKTIFAREMHRELRALLESGKLRALPVLRGKKRPR
jgi:DNA-binding transcriptional MerR regulator